MEFATAYKIPYDAVTGLLGAAIPIRRLFRKPICKFWNYVDEHSLWKKDYCGDPLTLAIMLRFIKERHRIDLLNSVLNNVAASLTQRRESEHLFFDNDQKNDCLEKLAALDVDQTEWELFCVRYCRDVGVDETGARERREALGFLVECLAQVDEEHSVLLIG